MTSSLLNWWFEYGKILKILILENFGKIRQTLFKMPRRQTRCPDVKQDAQMPRRQTRCPDAQTSNKMPRCPDVKQDAQANEMPRCPMRCPGKQDAQMPRQTKCPDAQWATQMSHEMPRCHTRCPGSNQSGSGHIGIWLYSTKMSWWTKLIATNKSNFKSRLYDTTSVKLVSKQYRANIFDKNVDIDNEVADSRIGSIKSSLKTASNFGLSSKGGSSLLGPKSNSGFQSSTCDTRSEFSSARSSRSNISSIQSLSKLNFAQSGRNKAKSRCK